MMTFIQIRGMLPHKTPRGEAALQHLKVFEGVPPPYDKVKKFVIPEALRVVRLKRGRVFCRIGDLSSAMGWKYAPVIAKLETKRKTLGHAFHKKAKVRANLKKQALATVAKDAKIAPLNPILQAYGY
jgi:large subunit ribosomal protein L13Ae